MARYILIGHVGPQPPNRGGALQHRRGLNPWPRVQQPSTHCTLAPEGFEPLTKGSWATRLTNCTLWRHSQSVFKDMSKIMTWHIWEVTYLCRNVTIVCGASCHLLGSRISWDLKIQFQLWVESYISDWQFSKLQHLASSVSRHNAMAYNTRPHEWSCQMWKSCGKKPL